MSSIYTQFEQKEKGINKVPHACTKPESSKQNVCQRWLLVIFKTQPNVCTRPFHYLFPTEYNTFSTLKSFVVVCSGIEQFCLKCIYIIYICVDIYFGISYFLASSWCVSTHNLLLTIFFCFLVSSFCERNIINVQHFEIHNRFHQSIDSIDWLRHGSAVKISIL